VEGEYIIKEGAVGDSMYVLL